jgi:hypothetical protein
MSFALDFSKVNGVFYESEYPYTSGLNGTYGACNYNRSNAAFFPRDWY